MRLFEIVKYYITPIRKFEKTLGEGFTGKDVLEYYRRKYDRTPMDVFMEHHFREKVFAKARTQEQSDYLVDKCKQFSGIAQRLFEKQQQKEQQQG